MNFDERYRRVIEETAAVSDWNERQRKIEKEATDIKSNAYKIAVDTGVFRLRLSFGLAFPHLPPPSEDLVAEWRKILHESVRHAASLAP
jgi:hypothetical protein